MVVSGRRVSRGVGWRARPARRTVYTCLAIATVAAGCGRRDPITFAPVVGSVTVVGRPLGPAEAEIIFVPDASRGTTGPMSIGAIAADGTYALVGPGGRRGAVVGNHIVHLAVPNASERIAQPFLTATTSPLRAEVRPQTVNRLDFNVEKGVP